MTPTIAVVAVPREVVGVLDAAPLYDIPARVLSVHAPADRVGLCRCGQPWPCKSFVLAVTEVGRP